MQVNSAVIGKESGYPQDINSDPAWSGKSVHTNIKQTAFAQTLYNL
jgi:hypothetical protein